MLKLSELNDLFYEVKKRASGYDEAARAELLNTDLTIHADLSGTRWQTIFGIYAVSIQRDVYITLDVDLYFFENLACSSVELSNDYGFTFNVVSREMYDREDKGELSMIFYNHRVPYIHFKSDIILADIECNFQYISDNYDFVTMNELQYFKDSQIHCGRFKIDGSDFELFKSANISVQASDYWVSLKLTEDNLRHFEDWLKVMYKQNASELADMLDKLNIAYDMCGLSDEEAWGALSAHLERLAELTGLSGKGAMHLHTLDSSKQPNNTIYMGVYTLKDGDIRVATRHLSGFYKFVRGSIYSY